MFWRTAEVAAAATALAFGQFAFPATIPQPVSRLRPLVVAVLNDGECVEGLLERFDDGEYWLISAGQRRILSERQLSRIEFRAPQVAGETSICRLSRKPQARDYGSVNSVGAT